MSTIGTIGWRIGLFATVLTVACGKREESQPHEKASPVRPASIQSAPGATPSGWQVRAIPGKASTPNPERSSGTPFKEGDEWRRYARVATISFDPASPGNWSTRARSVIKVDTVVTLEARNDDTKKWSPVPGKDLFSAHYARFVEAQIDDAGAVTFDFDDGSPATDPDNHLAVTIAPNPAGQEAVTISGPHEGAAPYNLFPDTMNAQCLFQKRKGLVGKAMDVQTHR